VGSEQADGGRRREIGDQKSEDGRRRTEDRGPAMAGLRAGGLREDDVEPLCERHFRAWDASHRDYSENSFGCAVL
jgi:hypothetical protein